MRMKNFQGGFTLVESLFVILIVTIIGFGGYYVWSNQNKNEEAKQTVKSQASTKNERVSKSDDWFKYVDPKNQYEINLPDGWKFDRLENSGMLYSPNAYMKDISGVPATVKDSAGQYGLGSGFSLMIEEFPEDSDYGLGEEQLPEFKTKQKIAVHPTYTEVTEEGNMSYEKGAKIYKYYIPTPGYIYIFEYSYGPSDKDQRVTVEKSIKSLYIYQ